jgi:hypothetical protein
MTPGHEICVEMCLSSNLLWVVTDWMVEILDAR